MAAPARDVVVVDGMFCAACAAGVEVALARLPGVERAAVNFAADAAVVEWRSGERDLARALAAVRRLGYHARSATDGDSGQADVDGPARGFALRLAVALFFGMWTMLPSVVLYLETVDDPVARFGLAVAAGSFSLPVLLWCGLPFYRMAWNGLRAGTAGIDALVTVGVAGSVLLSALALADGGYRVYFEVPVALITMQLLGRLVDARMRRRARDAVLGLLDLAPASAARVGVDGSERRIRLAELAVGDRVRLRPGERASVDGRVRNGSGALDRSLLSGEARPAAVAPGGRVFAGELLVDGSVDLDVTAVAGRRRIDELAMLVRHSLAAKPPWQRRVDRLARHFRWQAHALAEATAAAVLYGGGSADAAAVRALSVFVIACPCALSLAAPLTALAASAAAARDGVVLRDLNALAGAERPDLLFLDKTGTLTLGAPRVVEVLPAGGESRAAVLAAAALAEQGSEHPLAAAIRACAIREGIEPRPDQVGRLEVRAGRGVEWTDGRQRIRAGTPTWLRDCGLVLPAFPNGDRTRVVVARDDRVLGAIDLDDALRPGAVETVRNLRERGIAPVILSGDGERPVARVAAQLGIPGHAGLSPEAKQATIEAARSAGRRVGFAGDGINDAPALAAADLGIAVGSAVDSARAAAAVVLVDAEVNALPAVFDLLARGRRVLAGNLVRAVLYNLVAIPAAMLGWVHPAVAAVAMALSSLSIVVSAFRLGRHPAAVDDDAEAERIASGAKHAVPA